MSTSNNTAPTTSPSPTEAPSTSVDAVMVQSVDISKTHTPVKGYDFNAGLDYEAMFNSFLTQGFQATKFGLAVEQINQMVR